MDYKEGYVYHIKDEYFAKAGDNKLMANKENGNFRPTFFCLKDEKTSLLWVVPMSTKYEKYQNLAEEKIKKYGESLGIVIGKYDGRQAAFLVQNMFPIKKEYLDHIHTRNGNPVPVALSLQHEIKSKVQKARLLTAKGKQVVFPDILRLEKIMMEENSIDTTHARIEFTNSENKTSIASISRKQLKDTAARIRSEAPAAQEKKKSHEIE